MRKQIISNQPIRAAKLQKAEKIMRALQQELRIRIQHGAGPFLAAIYDEKGNLVSMAANSVVDEVCSNNHAEMNAIKRAEAKMGSFDLAPFKLSLYTTAEPCLMCVGGIMWSGIQTIYFGVPSKQVEEITGFDEGFKADWLMEFKKRGIAVYGNIAPEAGEKVLKEYVKAGKTVYKPTR